MPTEQEKITLSISAFKKRSYLELIIPFIVMVSLLLTVFLVIVPIVKNKILEERKIMTKNMTQSICSLIAGYDNLVTTHVLTLETAQKQAIYAVKSLRYGSDLKDYFWIMDFNSNIISHPYYIDSAQKDSSFAKPLKMMCDIAKANDEGFVEYNWQWKDDPMQNELKISFVKAYKPWGWIVGTGFYQKEVSDEIKSLVRDFILLSSIICIALLIMILIILYLNVRNIAKIVEKQNELNINKSQFRNMAANTVNGLFIYENNTIIFTNKRAREILGLNDTDELEPDLLSYLCNDEKERVKSVLNEKSIINQELDELEFWICAKDGTKKYIIVRFAYEQKKNALLTYLISTDITEKKTFERTLTQLSETINQVPASIIITDLDGKIEYVNPVFEINSGYTFDEVVGKKPSILKSGQMPQTIYTDLWQTITSGNIWRNEILNKKKNGDLFWESTIIFPIKNDAQKIINYAAVKLDITESKLIHEELIKAKDKAIMGEKIKTAFLANVSHEINTPLQAIYGFTQLLKLDLSLKEKQYEHLTIIQSNAEVLMQIFRDIFDFTKIESGNIELNIEKIELNNTIQKLISKYNTKITVIEKKPIEILFDPDPLHQEIMITSDRQRLIQIIDKLVSNSIKFTDRGYIKIGYKVVDSFIQFTIDDTGIGIDDDEKEKVYETFYHGDAKYISQHKGTGLGLNITKKLVEIMGGRIWHESKKNIGTTFCFTLPLNPEMPESTHKDEITKIQFDIIRRSKILIADDDETNFNFINDMLRKFSCEVLWAGNGKDAIEILDKNKDVDIVIIDIFLPIIDGINVTKLIKNLKYRGPVIAQVLPEDKTLVNYAGLFDDIIYKPTRKKDLYQTLLNHLVTFLVLFFSFSSFAAEYTIDTIAIHSEVLNETRNIILYKPIGLQKSDTTSFLYLLDGEFSKPRYDAIIKERLNHPVIGVGIINTNRNRDMLPLKEPEKFLNFICKELMPTMEKGYFTKQRILFGHSFAGSFTVYSMIHEPGMFDKYIASSPTPIMNMVDSAIYSKLNNTLDKKIKFYFSYGSQDMKQVIKWAKQLEISLKGLNLSEITWGMSILEGENHNTSDVISLIRGLNF